MPIEPIAPLLFIQQMGPAGNYVKNMATHPETSQNTFRHVAEEALSQQGSQVQGIGDLTLLMSLEDKDSHSEKDPEKMFKEYQGKEPPEEEEQEQTAQTEEAHLGNFVNRKV